MAFLPHYAPSEPLWCRWIRRAPAIRNCRRIRESLRLRRALLQPSPEKDFHANPADPRFPCAPCWPVPGASSPHCLTSPALVRAESPSDNKAAVDACVALAAAHAKSSGRARQAAPPAQIRQCARSAIRAARQTGIQAAESAEPILLLGHLDTVWPLGTLKTMPCRVARRPAVGPGTLDMKAGVAMAFTAIEMLLEADLLNREIVLLLNTDEEVGSPVSRPITERLARRVRRRLCAGAGAGAGLQNRAQRHRQLANRCEGRRGARRRGLRKRRERHPRTGARG